MKFREHRGSLEDSLRTMVEIAPTSEALCLEAGKIIGRAIDASELKVEPYTFDDRIKWDTHIVVVNGYGPIGFTDSPLTPNGISCEKTKHKNHQELNDSRGYKK